jgi:hypothetical protein
MGRADARWYTGQTMSDLVPLTWWQHLERTDAGLAHEATLRAAATLVQDGATGVTLILPREPGLLVRARLAARAAGVEVRADQIDSATITLRFRRGSAVASRAPAQHERRRWSWLPLWPRARSTG